ncbi:MAG: TIGR00725 family protein [Chitinispirillaceae bacterium]|jgi:uncharacterized protein (TIGR00725 family)
MAIRPVVGVIGSGRALSEEVVQLAYEVGSLIAQRDAVLVCGGLLGVMEAAAKGAHENGGFVVGILPTAHKTDANPYVDLAIPTGLGIGRNALVAHTADALIAFPGSFGTLSEIALALDSGKSVVFLPGAWDLRKAGRLEGTRFLEAFDAKQAVGLALGEIGKKLKKE